MGFKNQSVFTTTYTNTTFTVTEGMGIESITINLVSGSATLLGGLQFPGLTLSSVALSVGQPVVLNVNSGYTLTDITVDSTAGGVFQVFTVYAYNNSPDPSAVAYLAATGITGAVQSAAIDTLVKSLKATNLWSNMKAIYPFVTDNYNFLSYTEDFGNAYWNKSNITVTTNTTTAPDGTNTADTFIENTSTSTHYIDRAGGGFTATAGLNTMSLYVKKIVRDWFCLSLFDGTNSYSAWFNIANGTIGTVLSGTTASISNAGNGWYRISITSNLSSTGNFLAFFGANADNSISYTGNGLASYYVWGAQLEVGTTATTYQPIATTQQAYISNQFKYNLVNPVDSDAAFRLVFNGGWTFSTNGALPNGTNGYADTKLNQALYLTQTNGELGGYFRTDAMGPYVDIGSYYITGNFALITKFSDNNFYGRIATQDINSNYQPPTTLGLFSIKANGTNSAKFVRNGNIVSTKSTTTSAIESYNTGIAAGIGPSGGQYFSPRQTAFNYISNSLTDAQAANLYTIVQAYQTALSRQV